MILSSVRLSTSLSLFQESPILVLEDILENAKELVDKLEARLQTQRESPHGSAVEVGTIVSQGGERSNDDDGGLSGSDLSSDDERYSSDKMGVRTRESIAHG